MSTDLIKQAIERIRLASNILVLLANKPSGDATAASLALQAFLKKLEKSATVVAPLNELNQKFDFLPGFSEIAQSFNFVKNFVIDVSTKKVSVQELSYKKEEDKLSIFLKPTSGQLESSDITFRNSSFPFELIICIGISSLDQLGHFYGNNAELFFETPVINLDYQSGNENYGQINLIRVNATSTSEIVLDLISDYEASMIDEEIATRLLTGIISETNSFQHIKTTPAAFTKASFLVNVGAKQQEIIRQLYKTKSVGFLKLWGRVLARLNHDIVLSLAYSHVTANDLDKASAQKADLDAIIVEMASQLAFAKTFLFLVEESRQSITVYIATHAPINLLEIFARFKPEIISSAIKFVYPDNLPSAQLAILAMLGKPAN